IKKGVLGNWENEASRARARGEVHMIPPVRGHGLIAPPPSPPSGEGKVGAAVRAKERAVRRFTSRSVGSAALSRETMVRDRALNQLLVKFARAFLISASLAPPLLASLTWISLALTSILEALELTPLTSFRASWTFLTSPLLKSFPVRTR